MPRRPLDLVSSFGRGCKHAFRKSPHPDERRGVHETGCKSLVIRPNRSLPVVGVVALFAALSAVALMIGVSFTLAGAWMVLPFTGLQVVIVGILCRWLYRHLDDCELVIMEPERVCVIKRRGAETSSHEFHRYWVRVVFDHGHSRSHGARLLIGSHGNFVSLADDVSDADRATVADALKQLLSAPAQIAPSISGTRF